MPSPSGIRCSGTKVVEGNAAAVRRRVRESNEAARAFKSVEGTSRHGQGGFLSAPRLGEGAIRRSESRRVSFCRAKSHIIAGRRGEKLKPGRKSVKRGRVLVARTSRHRPSSAETRRLIVGRSFGLRKGPARERQSAHACAEGISGGHPSQVFRCGASHVEHRFVNSGGVGGQITHPSGVSWFLPAGGELGNRELRLRVSNALELDAQSIRRRGGEGTNAIGDLDVACESEPTCLTSDGVTSPCGRPVGPES